MTHRRGLVLAGVCLVAAAASRADAHLISTDLGPFYDGALHALATPIDVLTVLALTALAALGGPDDARAALVAFAAAWVGGAAFGVGAGAAPTGLIVFGPVALLALGLGGACDAPLGRAVAGTVAAVIGIARGVTTGAELQHAGETLTNLLGFACAVVVLTTVVSGAMVWLAARPTRIGVRVAASWLAALGLLLLGWQARGVLGA